MKAPQPDWQPLEETVPAEIFKTEVQAWARKIGVEPKEIQLRPMKRKWASCSTNGRLTFDTDLLRQPADFRREVIVHELLHLKVARNPQLRHSPVWLPLLRVLAETGWRASRPDEIGDTALHR
jgi:predicted metal-dependent hydrolase